MSTSKNWEGWLWWSFFKFLFLFVAAVRIGTRYICGQELCLHSLVWRKNLNVRTTIIIYLSSLITKINISFWVEFLRLLLIFLRRQLWRIESWGLIFGSRLKGHKWTLIIISTLRVRCSNLINLQVILDLDLISSSNKSWRDKSCIILMTVCILLLN